jgi:3-oxoacyl-[acyl-carrier protein] reductase
MSRESAIAMTSVPVRALVTGGSGAIGSAICRRLADAGHFVYVHAHERRAAAEQLAAQLNAGKARAAALCFDVADSAATRAALETVLEAGPVQVLVNNAGIHADAVFPAMSESQWRRVLDVAVTGFFNVTQPLLLPMIRTRWGRIVNISSLSSLIGNRGQVNYAAAKGAVNAATRALAVEVASRGVTVNAVAPGIISTPMSAPAFDEDAISRMVPMRRAGTPEEVASLVGYLASPEASYITGQIISVNGGVL